MIKPFLGISLFFLLSLSTFAQELETYYNSRFDFLIDYPKALFSIKEYPQNGDGVWLKNKNKTVQLTPSASYAMEDDTIRSIYRKHIKWRQEEKAVELTYKAQEANWFVLSGYDHKNSRIFYQKHVLYHDSDGFKIIAGYTYEYPIAKREHYDKWVKVFNKSFSVNTLLAEDSR